MSADNSLPDAERRNYKSVTDVIKVIKRPSLELQEKKEFWVYGLDVDQLLLEPLFWISVCWVLMMKPKKDATNISMEMLKKILKSPELLPVLWLDSQLLSCLFLSITPRPRFKKWNLKLMELCHTKIFLIAFKRQLLEKEFLDYG